MHTFTFEYTSEKALRSVLQVLLFLRTAGAGIQDGTISISSASLHYRKPCNFLSLSLKQSLFHTLSYNRARIQNFNQEGEFLMAKGTNVIPVSTYFHF